MARINLTQLDWEELENIEGGFEKMQKPNPMKPKREDMKRKRTSHIAAGKKAAKKTSSRQIETEELAAAILGKKKGRR